MPRKFFIFPILFILFTAGIFPYSYASPESEAQEDMYAGCRSEQTLVYRVAYLDYVCVEPSTAKRWVELGFAEIIQNSTGTNTVNESNPDATYEEKYPGAPPPPPTKTPSETDSLCRDGQVLVYRLTHQDNFCINQYTAITWERLGMVEILDTKIHSEIIVDSVPIIVEPIEELIVEDEPKVIEEAIVEDEPEPIEELIVEDKAETNALSEFNLIEYPDFPKIYQIDNGIWAIVDHDNTSSVMLEGDTGLVMIDSLKSYVSMKKVMNHFEKISDNHVKVIILTTASSESISASSAVVSDGVDKVEMILSDELLYLYNQDYDLKIENVITYPTQQIFSINVGGVEVDLISFDGYTSEQTYISSPITDGLLVGDSETGIFPIVLDMKHVEIFNDEKSGKKFNK